MKDENNIAQAFEEVLGGTPMRKLKSENFTDRLMRKISLADMEMRYAEDKKKQFLLGFLGLGIFITFLSLVYLLWNHGILQNILPDWITSNGILQFIAVDGVKFAVGALVIHLILSRGAITYFMFKRS